MKSKTIGVMATRMEPRRQGSLPCVSKDSLNFFRPPSPYSGKGGVTQPYALVARTHHIVYVPGSQPAFKA